MSRIKDSTIGDWLIWARNYGEVVSYRIGTGGRRRFRVRVAPGATRNGHPVRPREGLFDLLGHDVDDVVPSEMMLTAREALVFAYGCAVGRLAATAGERPEWRGEEWTPQAIDAFRARMAAACEMDREDYERELRERNEERERRAEEYRRRRQGPRELEGSDS